MLLLPGDLFNDRMTQADARVLRRVLETPVQEGPQYSWDVATPIATELFGSPYGRTPSSSASAPSTRWQPAFDSEIVALSAYVHPGTVAKFILWRGEPLVGMTPMHDPITIDGDDGRVQRVDFEDDLGQGGLPIKATESFMLSVEVDAIGIVTARPFMRRDLRS